MCYIHIVSIFCYVSHANNKHAMLCVIIWLTNGIMNKTGAIYIYIESTWQHQDGWSPIE